MIQLKQIYFEVIVMSVVYNMLQQALHFNMKERNKKLTGLLRFVLSEIQRNPVKDYSDPTVIATVKKIVNQLKENTYVDSTEEIAYLEEKILPTLISDDQLIEAIKQVDFSEFKNKFAAIGMIVKQFPAGTVDGAKVRQLIIQLGI